MLKKFTVKLKTNTTKIYGHFANRSLLQLAENDNIISNEEIRVLEKYTNAIFLGKYMSEKLKNFGNSINSKIHLYMLKNNINNCRYLAIETELVKYLQEKYEIKNVYRNLTVSIIDDETFSYILSECASQSNDKWIVEKYSVKYIND